MKTKGAELVWFDGDYVKWEEAKVPVMTHALHYGHCGFRGYTCICYRQQSVCLQAKGSYAEAS